MLQQLVQYAQKHELTTEPGFSPKRIRWLLQFAEDGRFVGIVELGDTEAKRNPGKEFPRCPDLSQPEMISRGETRSHFLVDTLDVVTLLGVSADDTKKHEKHRYFVARLREAGAECNLPELLHAADALSDETILQRIREELLAAKAKPTDKVTVARLGNDPPVSSNVWHDWWRAFRAGLKVGKAPGGRMVCFVTGEDVIPAPTHPKIQGLADVGGIATGSSLIGFDKEAFESYGLEQSANCAVSEAAASAYRAGLNDLITHHSRILAGAKVAHWFQEAIPARDDPLPWLEDPLSVAAERREAEAQAWARRLLQAIEQGERPDLAQNRYFALTLSGAAGRVMVRDWMEGPFAELVENVRAWFDDLSIVHRDGGTLAPPPKFLAVLASTVRQLDELAPPLVARMWRVAVRNEAIPSAVLAQVLARVRIDIVQDEPSRHAAMGLLRAYHVRRDRKGGKLMSEGVKPFLNEDHPSPAYQCGRLMAVLAALQRAALGDVGAGVVQRYYAAASATPSLVLGRLIRTSQFHLNALRNPRLAWWYENQLASILTRIRDAVPVTLTLDEQSLFALGYYQQLADLRTRKTDVATQMQESQQNEEGNENE